MHPIFTKTTQALKEALIKSDDIPFDEDSFSVRTLDSFRIVLDDELYDVRIKIFFYVGDTPHVTKFSKEEIENKEVSYVISGEHKESGLSHGEFWEERSILPEAEKTAFDMYMNAKDIRTNLIQQK